jgi:transcription elongation GreA/GreB family factor
MNNIDLKTKIHQALVSALNSQIAEFSKVLSSIKVSKNDDTKSSAGDKFETGREMMQVELDKTESQLNKVYYSLEILNQLKKTQVDASIKLGSLVMCDSGTYYMSIGYGSISVDGVKYFAISLKSPIGELLFGKRVGDQIQLNNRIISILDIC